MMNEIIPLLSQHLPFVPVYDTHTYPDRRELSQAMKAQHCNLTFLDVSSNPDRALAVITDLLTLDPQMRIFALVKDNDTDLILRCLRQGATEFFLRPFTSDQIAPALDKHIKAEQKASSANGKVYCVIPAKGACGASTVAANLAFHLKRLGSKRVLLADLDPLTGTVSFILKVRCQYSFLDVLSRAHNLDADIWKGLVTTSGGSSSSIDVLLPPEHVHDALSDLTDASLIVDFARSAYDAVVVDPGNAYGEWTLGVARLADEIIVVTTNELPTLHAAQRTLAYLDLNQIHRSKVRMLVNRYNREIGLSREVIGTALHSEVFGVIPSDFDAVQKALLEGKPVVGGTAFGKSLASFAERLAGPVSQADPAPKKPSSGLGVLRSLFSR